MKKVTDYTVVSSEIKNRDWYVLYKRQLVFTLPISECEAQLLLFWALNEEQEPIALKFKLTTKSNTIEGKWCVPYLRHQKFAEFFKSKDYHKMLDATIVRIPKIDSQVIKTIIITELLKIKRELKN